MKPKKQADERELFRRVEFQEGPKSKEVAGRKDVLVKWMKHDKEVEHNEDVSEATILTDNRGKKMMVKGLIMKS